MQKSVPNSARACRLGGLAGWAPPIAGWRLLGAFGATIGSGVRQSAENIPLGAFAIAAGRSARGHAANAWLLADIANLGLAGPALGSSPWLARNRKARAGQAGVHARSVALDDAGRAAGRSMSRSMAEPRRAFRQDAVPA
jgi:hypothetical protein